MPDAVLIDHVEEPYISAQIIVPVEFIGNIMKLANDRRGVFKDQRYIDIKRVDLHFEFPLAEIIFDFYDRLKICYERLCFFGL